MGTYSVAGSGVCTSCAAGLYGATVALPASNCSGLCLPGRFGTAEGLTLPSCSGLCPVGKYSEAGATVCVECPSGYASSLQPGGGSECLRVATVPPFNASAEERGRAVVFTVVSTVLSSVAQVTSHRFDDACVFL